MILSKCMYPATAAMHSFCFDLFETYKTILPRPWSASCTYRPSVQCILQEEEDSLDVTDVYFRNSLIPQQYFYFYPQKELTASRYTIIRIIHVNALAKNILWNQLAITDSGYRRCNNGIPALGIRQTSLLAPGLSYYRLKCYYRPTASLQLNNKRNTKYNITVT